jgi:hypothetical protein
MDGCVRLARGSIRTSAGCVLALRCFCCILYTQGLERQVAHMFGTDEECHAQALNGLLRTLIMCCAIACSCRIIQAIVGHCKRAVGFVTRS